MKLRKYDKKFDVSYTLGVFPTLALFEKKPEIIKQVLLHFEGDRNVGVQQIKKLCKQHHVACDYSPKAIGRVAKKDNTYVIGVFEKYKSAMDPKANHVVLHNPSNTGNLGTILRTMAGFGFKDLAIIRPAVDIFDPKVIRSAMGAAFDVRFEYFDSFEKYQTKYGENRKLYTFMLRGEKELSEITFEKPFSLVFGNEASGLPKNFKDFGTSVRIDQTKDIDSLNLSISVGVALYKASR